VVAGITLCVLDLGYVQSCCHAGANLPYISMFVTRQRFKPPDVTCSECYSQQRARLTIILPREHMKAAARSRHTICSQTSPGTWNEACVLLHIWPAVRLDWLGSPVYRIGDRASLRRAPSRSSSGVASTDMLEHTCSLKSRVPDCIPQPLRPV
jgi:hypothetical protein